MEDFCSRKLSLPGTFVPRSENDTELSLPHSFHSPLKRRTFTFEVQVSRHHVATARMASQVDYSAFGCCWRQFVSSVDRQTVVCVILCLLPPRVGRSLALVRWLVGRRPSVGRRPTNMSFLRVQLVDS